MQCNSDRCVGPGAERDLCAQLELRGAAFRFCPIFQSMALAPEAGERKGIILGAGFR